jgi:hypothetical protein
MQVSRERSPGLAAPASPCPYTADIALLKKTWWPTADIAISKKAGDYPHSRSYCALTKNYEWHIADYR